jgi:hypothetical protein
MRRLLSVLLERFSHQMQTKVSGYMEMFHAPEEGMIFRGSPPFESLTDPSAQVRDISSALWSQDNFEPGPQSLPRETATT